MVPLGSPEIPVGNKVPDVNIPVGNSFLTVIPRGT
jgi:hypothetical protein